MRAENTRKEAVRFFEKREPKTLLLPTRRHRARWIIRGRHQSQKCFLLFSKRSAFSLVTTAAYQAQHSIA
jgi:hypothetical protein